MVKVPSILNERYESKHLSSFYFDAMRKNLILVEFVMGQIVDNLPDELSNAAPCKVMKLLALHHPLDDFTRIVAKKSRKSQLTEWQSNQHQILMVASGSNPSLVVTYDTENVRRKFG